MTRSVLDSNIITPKVDKIVLTDKVFGDEDGGAVTVREIVGLGKELDRVNGIEHAVVAFEILGFVVGSQVAIELGMAGKETFNGFFVRTVNDTKVGDTGGEELFDDELKLRFIEKGNEMLGVGLNSRKETGGPAGDRNNGFGNLGHVD